MPRVGTVALFVFPKWKPCVVITGAVFRPATKDDSMSTVMLRDKDDTYVKAWRHHDLIGNMAQSLTAHDSQLHPPPRREAF